MQPFKHSFPIFQQPENTKLAYLDSAATTQKPAVVLEEIDKYYRTENANVHRGVHRLSEAATEVWEQSRKTIATFLGAKTSELIITRNTTEAINGIAYGWGNEHVQPGEVVFATLMEHHSNFVPWQELARKNKANFKVVGVTKEGRIDLADLEQRLKTDGKRTKLFAFTHVSNTLGTLNPVTSICQLVRQYAPQAVIVLDAAQSVAHMPVNFDQLDVDFLAFSGHKLYGPMGVGGLLVKQELLQSGEFQPWLFGGGMIGEVRIEKTTYNDEISDRFTAGTPDVASAAGLAAAIRFTETIGWETVQQKEAELVGYSLNQLAKLPYIKVIGPTTFTHEIDRTASVAFLYEGVHAHDVAQILDSENVAVRSGHHCTMPLHEHFGWPATVRASFGIYNDLADIDQLIEALTKVGSVFKLDT